jgi:hypothetical protein
VVVAGKHALPQWLNMDEAVVHCAEGIGIWQWASNDQDAEPDVVMACCGDTPTLEILAAVSILRQHLPDLKIRVVNVVDLMKLQSASEHPHGLSETDYDSLFTKDKHIIFGFHGYPWLVHRLTYRRTNRNLHVRGYKEADSRVCIDHCEEHTTRMALDGGYWAGITLYPTTKATPERTADMVEIYGPERILVNSSAVRSRVRHALRNEPAIPLAKEPPSGPARIATIAAVTDRPRLRSTAIRPPRRVLQHEPVVAGLRHLVFP